MIFSIENINNEKFTEALFRDAYRNMSEERRQKADRYRFESDRRQCVFSDYILRNLLREFSVSEPIFIIDTKGKPKLKDNNEVHFNISHSKNFIACVVDQNPVGIDIEIIREVTLSLINKVCTRQELDFVLGKDNNITDDSVFTRFFQIWTTKEAYLKYTGEGLSGGLKSISVATENGIKPTLSEGLYIANQVTDCYSISIVSEHPISLT